ncbi:MAG: hypothetical protein RLZZ245_2997 [Verrucomicrobiota bacterium]
MDDGFDAARRDAEVKDRAVADVGAPARQAVFVVAEGFKVLAPSAAPEARGDFTAVAELT